MVKFRAFIQVDTDLSGLYPDYTIVYGLTQIYIMLQYTDLYEFDTELYGFYTI